MKTLLIIFTLLFTITLPTLANRSTPHTEQPDCCVDIRGCGRRACN